MHLSTEVKLRVARILSTVARAGLTVIGSDPSSYVCVRNGVRWNLDLNEGIDLAVYLFGKFERDVSKALRNQICIGATVLDIGANIGAHTLPIACLVGDLGRVVAVEPTGWAYQKLQRNIGLNPQLSGRIKTLQAFLNDGSSEVPDRICSSWNLLEGASVRHAIHGGSLRDLSGAVAMSVDSVVEKFQLGRVDLIKLDVDGFETPVLRGAKDTLRKYRPVLILELSEYIHAEQGFSFQGFIDLIRASDYELMDMGCSGCLPSNLTELVRLIPKGGGINAIAIPNAH